VNLWVGSGKEQKKHRVSGRASNYGTGLLFVRMIPVRITTKLLKVFGSVVSILHSSLGIIIGSQIDSLV
jgi:hypothetical protein